MLDLKLCFFDLYNIDWNLYNTQLEGMKQMVGCFLYIPGTYVIYLLNKLYLRAYKYNSDCRALRIVILLLMESPKTNKTLGGGFQDFLFVTPLLLGICPIWWAYFCR